MDALETVEPKLIDIITHVQEIVILIINLTFEKQVIGKVLFESPLLQFFESFHRPLRLNAIPG